MASSLQDKTDEELRALLECDDQVVLYARVPPAPQCDSSRSLASVRQHLEFVQSSINSFQYNHTGRNYVNKRKDRGNKHVTLTAKEIIRKALPIQCVEAVFVGAYLTSQCAEIERYPLSFKSGINDHEFRHMVLAVCHDGQWGSVGISRRDTLMFKRLGYPSLSALVQEFEHAYSGCHHVLERVYVGLPFDHDAHADSPVLWKACSVDVTHEGWETEIDAFVRKMRNPTARLHVMEHLHHRSNP